MLIQAITTQKKIATSPDAITVPAIKGIELLLDGAKCISYFIVSFIESYLH